MATTKQVNEILRLANTLTGERVAYVSQSSVLSEPRNGWSNQEASLLIDDLKEAIEAENRRRDDTGVVEGAKIRFKFTRKNGEDGGILAGTVSRYKWSGTEVVGVYLSALDATEATFEPSGQGYYPFFRMHDINTGDSADALRRERERLTARIAEIDALLAEKDS